VRGAITVLLMTTTLLCRHASGAELKIDHVTVAGTDLKTMQTRLAAVGIPSEYGGPHSNHATQMALVSFQDGSYLELIALQENAYERAVAAHEWSKQLRANAGPTSWAVQADVAKEVERLRAAGIPVSAPVRNGRKRPDGTQLDWETARVGDEPNGTFFPFLIRDYTPRSARVLPSGKPTNTQYAGVTRVVILVRDLHAAESRYQRAYGLSFDERDDNELGVRLAWSGTAPVVLAGPLNKPLAGRSWYVERMAEFGEGPGAYVLGRSSAPSSRLTIAWLDHGKLGWRLGVE
jgi:hypothetical protein